MPEEAGCGMTSLPLYSGLVRSIQEVGAVIPALPASAVLKQMTPRKASMPTQVGGVFDDRKAGFRAEAPLGS